jgi:two-component system chemotaxis response regulator CheY
MQILVADDDRTSRLLVRASLEKLGHDAELVGDGDEAWSRYRDRGADVLIIDRVMPGIDGLELCRRVRAQPADGYTYVVLMTGMREKVDVLAGMEAGADDYLTKPIDPLDLQAGLVAAQRVTALHRQLDRYRVELERLNADLADLARRDALTGLGNRLRLDEDLAQLHYRCARYGWSYGVALCDIDHFKVHNDAHGHLAGDETLRQVSSALQVTARRGDGVYRYGGEEFVVVLPGQVSPHARSAADRLRAAVEASTPVTISVGVAAFLPDVDEDPVAVLRRADEALYRAKGAGRNRVSG